MPCVDQRLLPVPGRPQIYPFRVSVALVLEAKDGWLYEAKIWLKVKNINRAITEVLMKLLPPAISAGFPRVLLNDTNRVFGTTLQYCYMMLGNNAPLEKEASRIAMSAKWDGYSFSVLCQRVEDRCACASSADVPLNNA